MCKMISYENGREIAEINYIHNISEQAMKTRNIMKVMLFGSSITENCTEDSDIDIAIFGKIQE